MSTVKNILVTIAIVAGANAVIWRVPALRDLVIGKPKA